MNYNIINTGSSGNGVIIEKKILVDCGVTFKSLQKYYKKLKYVLLTHSHSDHFNKATIKKLALERPTLEFMCCKWLVKDLVDCGVKKDKITVIKIGKAYDCMTEDLLFWVEPIKLFHDVPNCGYKLRIQNEWRVLYATDTSKIDHINAVEYDYYFLEGNYDEDELEEKIAQKEVNGEFAYEKRVKETHLSKQQCDKFMIKNGGLKSKFVYMHEHKEGEENDSD